MTIVAEAPRSRPERDVEEGLEPLQVADRRSCASD